MQLDENQKKTVAGWVEEGLDLSAIQSRLESEMDVRMTYMDVRFLVGDLESVSYTHLTLPTICSV